MKSNWFFQLKSSILGKRGRLRGERLNSRKLSNNGHIDARQQCTWCPPPRALSFVLARGFYANKHVFFSFADFFFGKKRVKGKIAAARRGDDDDDDEIPFDRAAVNEKRKFHSGLNQHPRHR